MSKVTVLPHPGKPCPQGAVFNAAPGRESRARHDCSRRQGAARCEFNCACATCHVIVREGFDTLEEPSDNELDHLDTAWGACHLSRLSCQVKVGDGDLVIEIPKYNRNHANEA